MASIKDLKKDIEYFANDIVATLCLKNSITEGKEQQTAELVVKALGFKQEFIKKVNACPAAKNDKKAVKAYYRDLCKNAIAEFKQLIEEVNAL